jgi:hypothetical protein
LDEAAIFEEPGNYASAIMLNAELLAYRARGADQLVQEALDRFFVADPDFIENVMNGLSSL